MIMYVVCGVTFIYVCMYVYASPHTRVLTELPLTSPPTCLYAAFIYSYLVFMISTFLWIYQQSYILIRNLYVVCMYLYLYVCMMYICMYVCLYVSIFVCVHDVHMYACLFICIYICMCA